jgi:hypothetical protein
VSVVVTNTAVFGDLRLRRGVDDADLGADDDVGNSGVVERVTESLSDEPLSKYDVINLQGYAGAVKIVDGSLGLVLILEEDESNVVSLISRLASHLQAATQNRRHSLSGTKRPRR